MPVAVRRLHEDAVLPRYSTEGDAGADLSSVAEVTLAPGERALVPTGIALALPPGTVGLVHPRSGLAARHGVSIVNAPGTVDSGYRGEVLVNLVNLDPTESFTVRVGDRIAQLVVQEYLHADFSATDSLPGSARGETGHGSTGGFGLTDTP
ncbi:dUTP diphosphatase [Phycicoccus mangrovi]|uniref:dUTP diphosphatase n=1 Tax=Phycicoccus mangrovi TaxID=2840470 RepID=UPI0027E232F4|nr:dUTP diphosphatase [Phycicoccus mangrovi]